MRSKNYGINVRVTEQEKQKLLENARFCSLSLSEYLRRLGLGKEVRATITERDYRLFQMLNGLKAELPQLQQEEILSRLEAILNELKQARITPAQSKRADCFYSCRSQTVPLPPMPASSERAVRFYSRQGRSAKTLVRACPKTPKEKTMKVRTTQ